MLFICICFQLIICYWITNYFFPEENYFPCTQPSLVTVLLGLRLCKISPFFVSMLFGGICVQSLFRQPCWWYFMSVFSLTFLGDTISKQTPWSSGSYNISVPLTAMIPERHYRHCIVVDVSFRMGHHYFILISYGFL